MPRLALTFVMLAALAAARSARAADGDDPPPRPASDVVPMRFAWPVPARARVSYRRTRTRPGEKPSTFTARYEVVAEAAENPEDGVRIATRATTWRGDLPFPSALADDAIRATEAVVQRVRPQGEFAGLEGVAALGPVLARVLEDARVPPEQAERALALALAATRAEAEEIWNLAVGFWSGADLRLGQTYVLQSEADLPLVPGRRVPQTVEFGVRHRVPCSAAERAPRCVEAWIRSTPDRAALDRAAPALLARLGFPPEEPDADGEAAAAPAPGELTAERTLVLVTDPTTLLPRRVVWTRAVHLGGDGHAPPVAEELDRSEWDYRWIAPAKRAPARPALQPPSPPA